jgi:beta-glucoside operon transcriptional antiterminator
MQVIKKVLNSSVVLVEDEQGVERVLLGKGIGFGQKAGTQIDGTGVDRVFVSLDDINHENLVELLSQVPVEFVELTRQIVSDAESEGLELDPHIYLVLTDHLHFAVERKKRGLVVVNRLAWEMRTVYPKQYAVGSRAVELMNTHKGFALPDDEAANIAFHLANAERGKAGLDSMRVVELIRAVTTIVSNTAGVRVDRQDLNSSRVVTHLQYLAERFFTSRLLESDDDFLFHSLSERYPQAIATAERVRAFVQKEHQTRLPNEEVAFLALHIARAAPK